MQGASFSCGKSRVADQFDFGLVERGMISEHSSRVEARGWGLVASLETFRGFSTTMTTRRSGFNGLSISKSGEVRKIEIKTVERSDKWFAINGLTGIEKLFSDKDYWIYFVLVPENIIIITRAVPFLRKQVKYKDEIGSDVTAELKEWINLTKKVSRDLGLQFVPRISLNVKVPIRKMLDQILSNPNHEWDDVVAEIWRNKGKWECLFQSSLKAEDE